MKQVVFYTLAGCALMCSLAAVWVAFWSPLSVFEAQPIVAGLCVAGTLFGGCAVLHAGYCDVQV